MFCLSSDFAGTMLIKLQNFHKLPNLFLIFLVFICEILSSEVPRPRGVSLSRASLYIPDKDFTCFDGSKTIPFSQVNDDYCDCPDASDEPGTSACSRGTFHCTNAGHKPLNVASSRVNDGICDCCDGADEYASKQSCSNVCLELGRTARQEALKRAELVKAGQQLKADLSRQGIQMKEEKKIKLQELQKNKDEAEKIKEEKAALKKEAEEMENVALEYYRKLEEEAKKKKQEEENAKNRAEAVETFNKYDSNQDGLLDISELQTRQSFDRDRNGEVSEEEAKYFLNNQDSVDVETFVENCWSNVKPFLMMDAGAFKPPVNEGQEGEAEDMEDGEENQNPEAEEDPENEDDEDEPEPDHAAEPVEEYHEDPFVPYDEETQKIVEKATEARNQFADSEKNVRDIENEIKNIKEYLEKDFGPEEEFATLQGQCFDYENHEYIYKLCPFDKTVQQPKSGAGETRLGAWNGWRGPEHDKYEVMLYDRGQSCWNGPQRSTTVRVECGGDNKLVGVSEPNRCEYLFDFVTPAACRQSPENNEDLHDEL